MTTVRLSDDVAIEPLVDGWPAWLMLLDPVARGFYRQHHSEIVASFLRSPERHAAAVGDPRLQGGPFGDLRDLPYSTVERWHAWYGDVSRADIRFAADLVGFNRRSRSDAELPKSLRGRVEVVRCGCGCGVTRARPFRGAADRIRHLQVAVWRSSRRRPSMFSTPRIDGDPRIRVGEGTALDIAAVAALHHVAQPRSIAEARLRVLGIDPTGLLEEQTPAPQRQPVAHLVGHASIAVPLDSGWLLTDPIPPSASPAARGLWPVRVVLITHCHPDHLSIEALLALLPQQPVIVVPVGSGGPLDPSPGPALRALGFHDIVEVHTDDEVEIGTVRVRAMPFVGEHGSLPIAAKSTYLVESGDLQVVFAADATGADPDGFRMSVHLRQGDPLVIGMEPAGAPARWLYGPVLHATGIDSGDELLRGATAAEVLAMARVLGTRTIRICGVAPPAMNHVFGRSAGNCARLGEESHDLLRAAASAGVDTIVLDEPGMTLERRSR